jgi:hypothetical protein
LLDGYSALQFTILTLDEQKLHLDETIMNPYGRSERSIINNEILFVRADSQNV